MVENFHFKINQMKSEKRNATHKATTTKIITCKMFAVFACFYLSTLVRWSLNLLYSLPLAAFFGYFHSLTFYTIKNILKRLFRLKHCIRVIMVCVCLFFSFYRYVFNYVQFSFSFFLLSFVIHIRLYCTAWLLYSFYLVLDAKPSTPGHIYMNSFKPSPNIIIYFTFFAFIL